MFLDSCLRRDCDLAFCQFTQSLVSPMQGCYVTIMAKRKISGLAGIERQSSP